MGFGRHSYGGIFNILQPPGVKKKEIHAEFPFLCAIYIYIYVYIVTFGIPNPKVNESALCYRTHSSGNNIPIENKKASYIVLDSIIIVFVLV